MIKLLQELLANSSGLHSPGRTGGACEYDMARMSDISLKIDSFARKLDAELTGLRARHEAATTRMCLATDNESGLYFCREPEDEAILTEAEAQLVNVQARITSLEAQRTHLVEMQKLAFAFLSARADQKIGGLTSRS